MKRSPNSWLIPALVLALTVLVFQESVAARPATARKRASPLAIQGFRTGMTMPQVKWLLRKKGIHDYHTDFFDLFVFYPAPGAEVKLRFFSSNAGWILGRVELSASFGQEEAAGVAARVREQLLAKYGTSAADGEPSGPDFCWGQCGPAANGTKLTARITERDAGNLVLVLENRSIEEAGRTIREKKIGRWLAQWIMHVRRFKTGMTLEEASIWYRKRYQERLLVLEERDDTLQQHPVTDFAVEDKDFFTGLDYESLAFEGEAPGEIVLKFTGDQAGKNSRLNKRLYYASFSTTDFSREHEYGDLHRKLAGFIKIHGAPDIVQQLRDGIIANWQRNSRQVTVTIMDSGFMRYEQSDLFLKDAYRDAAVVREEGVERHRFDKPIF